MAENSQDNEQSRKWTETEMNSQGTQESHKWTVTEVNSQGNEESGQRILSAEESESNEESSWWSVRAVICHDDNARTVKSHAVKRIVGRVKYQSNDFGFLLCYDPSVQLDSIWTHVSV